MNKKTKIDKETKFFLKNETKIDKLTKIDISTKDSHQEHSEILYQFYSEGEKLCKRRKMRKEVIKNKERG